MSAMRKGLLGFGPANTTVVQFQTLMDSKSLWLTPNTTSVYMGAWLELGDEPMVSVRAVGGEVVLGDIEGQDGSRSQCTFRGVQPLLLGTYAPGERAHSPNERYRVDDFLAAIKTGIALFG